MEIISKLTPSTLIIESRDAPYITQFKKANNTSFDQLAEEQSAVIKSGGAGGEMEDASEPMRFLRIIAILRNANIPLMVRLHKD